MSVSCASKSCVAHEPCNSISDLHFFRFPEDEKTCRTWIRKCGRDDLLDKPVTEVHKKHFLCERHFSEECFVSLNVLNQNAVPNRFLEDGGKEIASDKPGSTMGPDVVVIPYVIMGNGNEEEVIEYGDGEIKEEIQEGAEVETQYEIQAADDIYMESMPGKDTVEGNSEENHYEIIGTATYVEQESAQQDTESNGDIPQIDNCLESDKSDVVGIIVEDDNSYDRDSWQQNQDLTLANLLCRICASEDGELIAVFGEKGEELQLMEKIKWHLPIEKRNEILQSFPTEQAEHLEGTIKNKSFSPYCTTIDSIDDEHNYEEADVDESQDDIEQQENGAYHHILDSGAENDDVSQEIVHVEVNDIDDCDTALKSKIAGAMKDIMVKDDAPQIFSIDDETAIWRCDMCEYEAPKKSTLIHHIRKRHAADAVACGYCEKYFFDAESAKAHERTHLKPREEESEPPMYMCEFCGKSFRGKKSLKEHHLANHSEVKPYKCDQCDKNYGSLASLDIHKATHSTETPYLCDLCGKSFKHINNLRSHKRCHMDETYKNRQLCTNCGKGFRSKFHLNEHMNVHNGVRPYSCDKCGKRFHKKIQLRQHGSAHLGEQPFSCHICGVKFNRRGNMTQHIKRHEHERKYTCRVCNESFPTLGAVLTHRKMHTDIEVERSIQMQVGDDPEQAAFKCVICGKLLVKKESLATHMRSHTGEKLFECNVCGKKLSNKGSLTYHMRSFHTGERPHTCQFCGEGFLSKEARLVHERIHTGEKPYKCSVCGMAFRCSSNLSQHIKVHSEERPHPCQHCGKAFQRKGALDVHMRTHTGERPYTCDICGRGFTQKNDMLKHRRIHTQEKPFRCDQCGQPFMQKRDLTKHIAAHGPKQEVQEVIEEETPTQTVVITTGDNSLITFPEIPVSVPVIENTQTVILHRF